MPDTIVVSDPRDELRLRDTIADAWQPGTHVLRIEPTPAGGKDRLAEDILLALRRRPRFAFRWSESGTKLRDSAWLWCHAHWITDIVIPRAHTLSRDQLTQMTSGSARFGYVDVDAVTWWLIDASPEGALAETALMTRRAAPTRMLAELEHKASERVRLDELAQTHDAPDDLGADTPDAHPAVFVRRLGEAVSGPTFDRAAQRFTAAALIARDRGAFASDAAALWYLLSNARSPADARLVLRAAQLGFLQRRVHLSLTSAPWDAAQDAQRRIAEAADSLLPYVDSIVAAIGAVTIAGAVSPDHMTSMAAEQIADDRIALHAGFEPIEPHPIIAAALRAQSLAMRSTGGPLNGPRAERPMLLRPPGAQPGRGTAGRVSRDRVNAVLREIEIERGVEFSLTDWCDNHGTRAEAV